MADLTSQTTPRRITIKKREDFDGYGRKKNKKLKSEKKVNFNAFYRIQFTCGKG